MDKSYYLRVVKVGEAPVWPVPEVELVIGSQPLSSGFIQYWAYPKAAEVDPSQKPEAEKLALSYLSSKPAVLIDQTDGLLDLILVNDGHAWAKTESSLANLEDNLSSILEFAKNQFNIKIEHFMTTTKVSKEAEEKLDEIEKGGASGSESQVSGISGSADPKDTDDMQSDKPLDDGVTQEEGRSGEKSLQTDFSEVSSHRSTETRPTDLLEDDSFRNLTASDPKSIFRGETGFEISRKKGSALPKRLLVLVLVLLLLGGGFFYKGKILSLLKPKPVENKTAEVVTSVPSPTPSPSPSFDRSQYTLRVLNGTSKTGQAAALADKLKGLGWKIDSVGNATNSATARSYVRVKPQGLNLLATLVQDLSPDLDATRSADLKDADKADAEVVIGKK